MAMSDQQANETIETMRHAIRSGGAATWDRYVISDEALLPSVPEVATGGDAGLKMYQDRLGSLAAGRTTGKS